MIMRKSLLTITIAVALVLTSVSCLGRSAASTSIPKAEKATAVVYISLEEALSNGKPTLAEFGSTNCTSCKMMKIILDELAVKYEDRLNFVIVSVYRHRDLARQYRIMSIPTQIFFDSDGNEVLRHTGVLFEESIIAQLNEMGID